VEKTGHYPVSLLLIIIMIIIIIIIIAPTYIISSYDTNTLVLIIVRTDGSWGIMEHTTRYFFCPPNVKFPTQNVRMNYAPSSLQHKRCLPDVTSA
jgi:hypothetical protein